MNIQTSRVAQHEIFCSKCDTVGFIRTDDGDWKINDTPSRYFKREGWREKEGKTLCPSCAKNK